MSFESINDLKRKHDALTLIVRNYQATMPPYEEIEKVARFLRESPCARCEREIGMSRLMLASWLDHVCNPKRWV